MRQRDREIGARTKSHIRGLSRRARTCLRRVRTDSMTIFDELGLRVRLSESSVCDTCRQSESQTLTDLTQRGRTFVHGAGVTQTSKAALLRWAYVRLSLPRGPSFVGLDDELFVHCDERGAPTVFRQLLEEVKSALENADLMLLGVLMSCLRSTARQLGLNILIVRAKEGTASCYFSDDYEKRGVSRYHLCVISATCLVLL